MADNLVQKRNESTWYVRLAVPADVQRAIGKKILTQSLKTGLRSVAMERRLPVLAEWKALIAKARGNIAEGHWKDASHTASRFIAGATDERLLQSMGRTNEAADVLADFNTVRELVGRHLSDGKATGFSADIARKLSALKALEPTDTSTLEAKMAYANAADETLKALGLESIAAIAKLNPIHTQEASEIIADHKSYRPASPITAAKLKAFRTFKENQGSPLRTLDNLQAKLKNLSAFLKDQALPLTFTSVEAWLDSLKVSSRTKGQYLWAGSEFWKWAIKHDDSWRNQYQGQPSPFKDHDIPKESKLNKRAERIAFTIDDVKQLRNAASPTLANVITIAAYTGARIEELCKLKIEDVAKVDGLAAFNITDSKTAAGIRSVPIHPHIAVLVDQLKQASEDGYLIKSPKGGTYGRKSQGFVNQFSTLKKKEGFGPQHTFHSFRKTFITELLHKDVAGPVIASIVGHETGTVTFDVYTQGASMKQKMAAVVKLSFQ
ncbi:tyrosine-type recombinase/integrase [Pseudomonas sp. PSE14]|uniref:tyrosine-type recombinase/integrase n=1 Tax=Pseudomonas sp. PSE14 TaxID=3016341 RepID=UPI0023D7D4E2|nr:tyrosine-type recombinase/integrase [Pseudomonas sp. PSE14]WEJ70439.1 tyrosine-type recombinase/integrase [Pseudomonas sp. PSE14]